MQFRIIIVLIIGFLAACSSQKAYYNRLYDRLAGDYTIVSLNFVSSVGKDSIINNAGTLLIEDCKYTGQTSSSICFGEAYFKIKDSLQNEEEVYSTFEFNAVGEDVLYISFDYSENELDKLLHGLGADNCNVIFEEQFTIFEFGDKEDFQTSRNNRLPYRIYLQKK